MDGRIGRMRNGKGSKVIYINKKVEEYHDYLSPEGQGT